MRFIFRFTLVICMISRLFGLESHLFGDNEWKLFDASSATISSEALSSDLGWTGTNNSDDIFALNPDSLNSLGEDDLAFDDSAIANACVNPGFRPRRRRRGQTQMQCGTEPPNESKTNPELTEITPSIATLNGHEPCPVHEHPVFAVCDSGNRFERYSQGDGFYSLASCTLREFVVFLCHRRPYRHRSDRLKFAHSLRSKFLHFDLTMKDFSFRTN